MVCQAGISGRSPQVYFFASESVLQGERHGRVPTARKEAEEWWMAPLGLPLFRREEEEIRKKSMKLLETVGLAQYADENSAPSLGNQRRLELARALALKPKLLLLDETFSGLRHEEAALLSKLVLGVRARGISVLLIEHNMKVAMGLSDRLVVLDHGRLLAEGKPEEIRSDPRVVEAYLGKGASAHAS